MAERQTKVARRDPSAFSDALRESARMATYIAPTLLPEDFEILKLLALGLSFQAIAKELQVKRRRVEYRVDVMHRRFGTISSSNLAATAVALQFVKWTDLIPSEGDVEHD